MSPLLGLLLLITSLVAYFGIRGAWIVWQCNRHAFTCAYWVRRTKQSAAVANELFMLWPGHSILLDLPWNWNWRHYVVHQDLHDAAMDFIREEIRRTDLDFATYQAELAADVAASASEQSTPAAPAAPADVTTTPPASS